MPQLGGGGRADCSEVCSTEELTRRAPVPSPHLNVMEERDKVDSLEDERHLQFSRTTEENPSFKQLPCLTAAEFLPQAAMGLSVNGLPEPHWP